MTHQRMDAQWSITRRVGRVIETHQRESGRFSRATSIAEGLSCKPIGSRGCCSGSLASSCSASQTAGSRCRPSSSSDRRASRGSRLMLAVGDEVTFDIEHAVTAEEAIQHGFKGFCRLNRQSKHS